MTIPIVVVQGAQWGSEGKGMVSGAFCERRRIDYAVRTGGVNAGHTVYYKGRPYKMQQLPCGWVNPGTKLVLGPGAYVNLEILGRELDMVRKATGAEPELYVDYRAGMHFPDHEERAGQSGRRQAIGATAKGCSEAVVDKIRLRGLGGRTYGQWLGLTKGYDTVELLNGAYDAGQSILIEGTQGTGLDLHLGPYPYTTHKQTIASAWLAECGLSPKLRYEIALVARTYPIRVAGNSGPMPKETDWPTVARRINDELTELGQPSLVAEDDLRQFEVEGRADFVIDPADDEIFDQLDPALRQRLSVLFETTTVTKRLRRVAHFDAETVRQAVMINRPDYIILTFLDYWYAGLRHSCDPIPANVVERLRQWSEIIGCPIALTSTGPESKHLHQIAPYESP